MAKKVNKKVTTVHKHPRRVPPSSKNPEGITIVDQHTRRLPGTYLDEKEIEEIFQGYERKGLVVPKKGKLTDYKNADDYDEEIAVWTDYFNKKFNANPSLDPDVVKALICSESGFRLAPEENKTALGIAQITKQTLKVLQDPKGEVKDFIFTKIRQKDLENPKIAIPMAIRWLMWKKDRAGSKLGRAATHEEIILKYKGLLKSKTKWKDSALEKYRKSYESLKKK